MFVNHVLVIAAAASATVAMAAPVDAPFDSYTKAYNEAGREHQPMLVILNPGADAENRLDVSEMSADADLSGYVVAEIDTTTTHGQEVHRLFKSPSLPHVVVIDNEQKKQIFKTSRTLSSDDLADVLARYRNGNVTTVTAAKPVISETPISTGRVISVQPYRMAPPANCPNCRRSQSYRF